MGTEIRPTQIQVKPIIVDNKHRGNVFTEIEDSQIGDSTNTLTKVTTSIYEFNRLGQCTVNQFRQYIDTGNSNNALNGSRAGSLLRT